MALFPLTRIGVFLNPVEAALDEPEVVAVNEVEAHGNPVAVHVTIKRQLILALAPEAKFAFLVLVAALPQDDTHRIAARFRLPETVHDQAQYRVWQRRYYVMSIFTEKKRLEKLHYMHGNPVKRGLVASPDQWPWSSFRFYYLEDASVLRMDRLDSSRQVSVLQAAQT